MSEYSDIKDFNYNATINKSITIKNGNDLKGATLEVVTDGVTLSGIQKANVTTQSSLKISSSSLSSLSIAAVPSANASQISGRGVSDNMRVNPPTVETDNTTVTSAVTVAIENAQIVAEKLIANEINLAGMNTQLTLKDNVSNISKITTDKVCQVILEKGVGTNIPNSTDKIEVSGSGELTQIDMTVQEGFTLVALTPMSSIKTLLKKGDSIDFTNLAMLGTYVSTSKMKIFRANLTVDFTETFSKLEKNFTVTIGDDKKEVFKGGEPTDFDWTTLENCVAEIDTDFANKSHDYKPFKFNIAVIGADIEELPEFELKSIEVQTGSAKTEYTVGDVLDLRRLLVLGNYEQGKYAYNGIITDYTLDPPNGTMLDTAGTQNVTVTAGGKTETIEITVKEVKPQIKRYAIQFNGNGGEGTMANQDMTCDVSADLTANTFIRTGYTFQGWAETANGGVKYVNQARVNNLSATNGTIVTFYAVWTANTYKVTLNNEGVTNIIDVIFDTIVPTITNLPTKTGFTFGGYWTQADGKGTQYIDADGVGKKWDIAENTTLYAYFMERGTHFIYYYNTKEAANLTNPQQFREAAAVTLPTIGADGYTFGGWYDSSTDFTDEHHITGWTAGAKTENVSLWARWTAIQYNITYAGIDGAINPNDTVKYTIEDEITLMDAVKVGYTFGGWSVVTNDGTSDETIDSWNAGDRTADVVLWARWTANQYDIIYKDGNSDSFTGTHGNSYPTTHTYGQDTTLVNPTKEHYQFAGWYIGSDCSGSSIETLSATGYTDTIMLYAKWTENPNYTVIFNANGGTGTMSNQKIYRGEATALITNSFGKGDDYTFYRWYDRRLGGGNSYDNNAIVSDLTGDGGTITLYAIWKYTKDGYNSYIDESGDIVINGTKYGYTSFAQVMDRTADIIGSDENWSSYLDSSASGEYKGAFISGRNVKLSPYSMAQYLVTQELYEAVMGSGRNYDKNSTDEGKHPAYYVSWYDAITFCNKLSLLMGKEPCYSVEKNGNEIDWAALAYSSIPTSTDSTWNVAVCDITKNGYRMPTEAEWEFAARGGDQSKTDWKYAFSGIQSLKQVYRGTTESDTGYGGTGKNLKKDDNLATVGWYTDNSSSKVHSVGGKTANRLGLSDMSGNLMEWCWDWHNGTVTSNDSEWIVDEVVTNPMGAGSGSNRCLRGGYWYNDACFCSVSYRSSGSNPYSRNSYIGFRLVCSGE